MCSDEKLIEMMENTKVIAVVGCSRFPSKAAHRIPRYMKEQGYTMIPVNPHNNEILGEKVYRSLSDIPVKIDMVNVFRPSEDAMEVVQEAIDIETKYIWMQLGIEDERAKEMAEEMDIEVTMDKCFYIEHDRLMT
jgi:predicted CoA-binding protein